MRLKATETGQHLYAVREYLHGKVETHYFEWEYQAINYRARVAEKKFNLLKFVLKITNQVFVKLSRCPESLVLHFLQKYFTRLLFVTNLPAEMPGRRQIDPKKNPNLLTSCLIFLPTADCQLRTPLDVVHSFSFCAQK